jgi:hypothetical protein
MVVSNSATLGNTPATEPRTADSRLDRVLPLLATLPRRLLGGVCVSPSPAIMVVVRVLGVVLAVLVVEGVVKEKGLTPARRAMFSSPSCQCIASAARQGTPSSSDTLAHISGLSLTLRR